MLIINRLKQRFENLTLSLIEPLELNSGDVLWVRGGNGAGKTTFLELLSHVQRGKTDMSYAGQALAFRSRHYINQVLYISCHDPLPHYRTVASYLKSLDITSSHELFANLPMTQLIETLSSGQKQRLRLAKLWIPKAVVVLDEPSSALDVHGQDLVWQRIDEIRRCGNIVVVADHIQPAVVTKELNCDEQIHKR